MTLTYASESDLSAAEFADVLRRSTLAERRPADDLLRLEGMLRHIGMERHDSCWLLRGGAS